MTFRTIQALRAVAALLVVLLHCFQMWGQRVDGTAPGVPWINGAAGVDIFFVISGFVMAVSSRGLSEQVGGWLTFIRHRIVRIVPLYWLLTTLKLVAVVAGGALALRSQYEPAYIAGSYLFLPVIDQFGRFRPLLPVGWTLSFEFLFYFIFAAALALKVNALRLLTPVLGAIAFAALFRTDGWPTWTLLLDTIVLEFLFGVVLARLILAGWRLPPLPAACALGAGFALLLVFEPPADYLRVVVWGLPALAIVAAAVSLEQEVARLIPKAVLDLGDASYSLYLSHGFVLPVLGVIVHVLGWSGPFAESTTIPLALLICSLVAVAIYRIVERPVLGALRDTRWPRELIVKLRTRELP